MNWWGPNNPTDTNLQTLLSVANERSFKVTICFDLNSPFQHWVESVAGMPAPGMVVPVLAGDYLKQLGIVPAAAVIPSP